MVNMGDWVELRGLGQAARPAGGASLRERKAQVAARLAQVRQARQATGVSNGATEVSRGGIPWPLVVVGGGLYALWAFSR